MYKRADNQILYHNGKKWLVKETVVDNDDAKSHEAIAEKRLQILRELKFKREGNVILFGKEGEWQVRERCWDQSGTEANNKLAEKRLEELNNGHQ